MRSVLDQVAQHCAVLPVGSSAMTVALTVMTAYPLWQMWARKPTRPARE